MFMYQRSMPFFPGTEVQSAWIFMKDNKIKQKSMKIQIKVQLTFTATPLLTSGDFVFTCHSKAWFCIFWNDAEIQPDLNHIRSNGLSGKGTFP